MRARLPLTAIMAAASLLMLSSLAQGARAGQPIEAGILRCGVASGWGFVLGSTKDLKCVFSPADGGPAESYRGEIQKIGIDVGYTESGVILWAALSHKPQQLAAWTARSQDQAATLALCQTSNDVVRSSLYMDRLRRWRW